MENRINPLPTVLPVYEHDWSVYPDKLRVAMENGKVVDYIISVPQNRSVLVNLVDKFTATCYGGQKYKRKNRRKRSGIIREEENNG